MRETASGTMLITLYELVEFGIEPRPHWKKMWNRHAYFVPMEEMQECLISARQRDLRKSTPTPSRDSS